VFGIAAQFKVRLGSEADFSGGERDVSFGLKSGRGEQLLKRPLLAISGHRATGNATAAIIRMAAQPGTRRS
jgi:hypothetical protein